MSEDRRSCSWECALAFPVVAVACFYLGVVVRPSHISWLDRLRGRSVYETVFYRRMVASHVRQDAQIAPRSIYLIGDSHIQGLCPQGLGINYGIGSDTTEGTIARIGRYASLTNAAKVFLEIGCNDKVADGRQLAVNILNVVAALPPSPDIYVCSLLPSAGRHRSDNPIKRDANAWLRDASDGRFGFIDLYEKLADEDGDLLPCYDSGDGVHLNAAGYEVLRNELVKFL